MDLPGLRPDGVLLVSAVFVAMAALVSVALPRHAKLLVDGEEALHSRTTGDV